MTKYLPSWPKLKNNYLQIFFAIFLIVMYFVLSRNLGRDALFDWDEGIYAELGRQVVLSKNLFIAYWNGAPWLEKPPGIAWITALGILIAGPSAYGTRLLMPFFAIYTLYIIYRIGNHLGGQKHGIVAAGILASLNLFLSRTRAVNTDMALLASISTTILFLLENRPSWWVAISIFGGVWFKGLAGLLSVIIALPLLLSKSRKYLLQTAGYTLLAILPWHVYAYLKYGSQFFTPYFLEQVIRRATAQIEFHFENRWYYFNYLYENLGIGVIVVSLVGVISIIFKLVKKPKERILYLTILWWTFVPLIIFTLAKTRLFWYILPIYPGIALLISEAICCFESEKISKLVISILALGIMVQALVMASRSVEFAKINAQIPDRLYVAQHLGNLESRDLAILVPPSERLSEALLPDVARLSSSFRYGGMPSIVFYYGGHVNFFYDVDLFRKYWQESDFPLAIIATEDKGFVPGSFLEIISTPTYIGIQKGVYALR